MGDYDRRAWAQADAAEMGAEEDDELSSPDDASEQEADQVADAIEGEEPVEIAAAPAPIACKNEMDPIKLGKPARPTKKKSAAKKPDLEKKKQELQALLAGIKSRAELEQAEPQLSGPPMPPTEIKLPPMGGEPSTPPGARPDSLLAPPPPKLPASPLDQMIKKPDPPSGVEFPQGYTPPGVGPDLPGTRKIKSPRLRFDETAPFHPKEASKREPPKATPPTPDDRRPADPAVVKREYDSLAPGYSAETWEELSDDEKQSACEVYRDGDTAFMNWIMQRALRIDPPEAGGSPRA